MEMIWIGKDGQAGPIKWKVLEKTGKPGRIR